MKRQFTFSHTQKDHMRYRSLFPLSCLVLAIASLSAVGCKKEIMVEPVVDTVTKIFRDTVIENHTDTVTVKKTDTVKVEPVNTGGWQVVVKAEGSSRVSVVAGTRNNSLREFGLDDFVLVEPMGVVELKANGDTLNYGIVFIKGFWGADFQKNVLKWTLTGSLAPSTSDTTKFKILGLKSMSQFDIYDTTFTSTSIFTGNHAVDVANGGDFRFTDQLDLRNKLFASAMVVVYGQGVCHRAGARRIAASDLVSETSSMCRV
jgi:hypothetical protein